MTKIFDFKQEINEEQLDECGRVLSRGGLVIFPTETVYGVGANALDSAAVDRIFVSKGRANDNPLIVHISNTSELDQFAKITSNVEKILIDAFFPGPFTLILKKKDTIPSNVSANLDTVGIRMPDSKIARAIIEAAGVPIAAPSANISSRPSGTKIEDITDEFTGKVDIIVDGGETKIGIESTVVRVIDDIPVILRPGKVTPDDIKRVVGVVEIDPNIYKKAEGTVRSPGMKYKHYAPSCPCVLVYSDDEDTQIELVREQIIPNTIVIGFKEHQSKIEHVTFYNQGSMHDYDEISHNIFSLLRQADNMKPDLIIIEGVAKEGLGIGIMNRLIRSSSYHYIEK